MPVRAQIPHDPASSIAGAPPGGTGQIMKMKKPRPSPAGPKNTCTPLSAHAKPRFTRSRWTDEYKKATQRCVGRAIENAHDEAPNKQPRRDYLRRAASVGFVQPNRAGVCRLVHNWKHSQPRVRSSQFGVRSPFDVTDAMPPPSHSSTAIDIQYIQCISITERRHASCKVGKQPSRSPSRRCC